MRFDNSFLIVSLIGIFFACSQPKKDESSEKQFNDLQNLVLNKSYYDNGKLRTEQSYKIIDGDSIPHGYSRLFYQNGQVSLEVLFQNGMKQGIEKGYYENGEIEYVGKNNNDKPDSLTVWYYSNSVSSEHPIKAIDHWSNGKILSHQQKYYKNGDIKYYIFYDPLERPIYKREYGKNGDFIEEGDKYPAIVMVTELSEYNFKKGDNLVARIYHIKPPKSETELYIRFKGLSDDWQKVSSSDYYTPVILKSPLKSIGKYTLEVKLEIRDNQQIEAEEYISMIGFTVS